MTNDLDCGAWFELLQWMMPRAVGDAGCLGCAMYRDRANFSRNCLKGNCTLAVCTAGTRLSLLERGYGLRRFERPFQTLPVLHIGSNSVDGDMLARKDGQVHDMMFLCCGSCVDGPRACIQECWDAWLEFDCHGLQLFIPLRGQPFRGNRIHLLVVDDQAVVAWIAVEHEIERMTEDEHPRVKWGS